MMTDWRRYTGTQRLQVGLTILAAVVVLLVGVIPFPIDAAVAIIGVAILWFVGLLALGFRDRRHWNRMVEHSSFDVGGGTRETDLERLLGDRSVYVEANMPTPLSQTHTEISAPVEGVDARFTVQFVYDERDASGGVETGIEELDARFRIEGREENVSKLVSPDVASALLDVETPGTCTVTGERVTYEVPFTRLSAAELDTLSDAVVELARQVEAVGKA